MKLESLLNKNSVHFILGMSVTALLVGYFGKPNGVSKQNRVTQVFKNTSNETLPKATSLAFSTADSKKTKTPSESIESHEKQFLELAQLEAKPFRSTKEVDQMHEKLSDTQLMSDSFVILHSKKGFAQPSRKGAMTSPRLNAISYVAQALSWDENPIRNEVISEIEKFIVTEVPTQKLTHDQKRSWVGDKIELFSILLQADPTSAHSLLEREKGTGLGKVLEYSLQYTKTITGG